jgi:hypothetical protein
LNGVLATVREIRFGGEQTVQAQPVISRRSLLKDLSTFVPGFLIKHGRMHILAVLGEMHLAD